MGGAAPPRGELAREGDRGCAPEGAQRTNKYQETGSALSLQGPVPCWAQGRASEFLMEADDTRGRRRETPPAGRQLAPHLMCEPPVCKPFPIKVCWGRGSQAQSRSEKRILKSPFLLQCLYGSMATISHRTTKPLHTTCLYTRGGKGGIQREGRLEEGGKL